MHLAKLCLAGWIICQAPLLPAQDSDKSASQDHSQSSPEQPREYHPGGDLTKPRLIYSVDPSYTNEARRKKLNGHTVLSIVVDSDGKPRDIRVIRSLAEEYRPEFRSAAEGLDRNAIQAVRKYRFEPSLQNGKAVPVSIKIDVNSMLF